MVAITSTGEMAWRVPFGEGRGARGPLLRGSSSSPLGTPGNAGSIVTRVAWCSSEAAALSLCLHKATGREVSRVPTGFRVSANPMTYKTRSGRQFVVVATGAGPDAALVGFALRPQ